MMSLEVPVSLSSLLTTPFQRVPRYELLLSSAVENFKKAQDTKISENIKIALQHSRDISVYVDDMMTAGRIKGFSVSVFIF